MGPLDALWHLANFFGPAIGVGLIASGLCKLIWWKALRSVAFGGLTLWAMAAGAVALIGGLVIFGRDGRMATYGLLVASTSLALWWRALRHLR
ncbi:MAG TPA: hypothetical protein VFY73_20155 [Ideonella sp.]|jgi:hypothetical protein|uniref:hypothetical protein n=1 Tax=Ideonella sp. TaxID=1929293 RepID=UPI002E36B021|nr:hypothetical protein [Ideonella sp.]HEX5686348.1 hypothetical protein [Ideonella sp.]